MLGPERHTLILCTTRAVRCTGMTGDGWLYGVILRCNQVSTNIRQPLMEILLDGSSQALKQVLQPGLVIKKQRHIGTAEVNFFSR